MKNQRQRIRLKDIAEAADVSVMSVSHVLNGTGAGRVGVGEERANHIRETAKRLSYVPSYAARALRGSSIRVIGAICYGAMDPVRVRALACLQWQAAQHDYHVMTTCIESGTMPWDVSVMAVLSHGVGALVAICDSLEEIKQAEELGKKEGVTVIPLRLDGGRLNSDSGGVQIDTSAGIQLALDTLKNAGSQRVRIYYSDEDLVWAKFAQQLASDEVSVIQVKANQSADSWVEKGDGILCSNDLLASQLIRSADGCLAGDDYLIIGWGNAAACDYMIPALTSIGLDLPAVMGFAMQAIIEDSKTEIMWVRPILINRETCRKCNQ